MVRKEDSPTVTATQNGANKRTFKAKWDRREKFRSL